jgi:hypothetical protein
MVAAAPVATADANAVAAARGWSIPSAIEIACGNNSPIDPTVGAVPLAEMFSTNFRLQDAQLGLKRPGLAPRNCISNWQCGQRIDKAGSVFGERYLSR